MKKSAAFVESKAAQGARMGGLVSPGLIDKAWKTENLQSAAEQVLRNKSSEFHATH